MEENSNVVSGFFNMVSYSLISIPLALFFIVLLYIVLHNNHIKIKNRKIKGTERKGFLGFLIILKNFILYLFYIIRFYAQIYVFSLMIIFTFWKYILQLKVSPIMNAEFYIAFVMTLVISVILEKTKQKEITKEDVFYHLKRIASSLRGNKK